MAQETRDYSWEADGEELVPLGVETIPPQKDPPPPEVIDLTEDQPAAALQAPANGYSVNILPGRPAPKNSAGEFTEEFMLRPKSLKPSSGWRLGLYKTTFGVVNVGPSPKEQRERELIAEVKRPINGCRRIAVISRKGGVGKTTTTLMLGHTFAVHRGDRVVALDGNPDAGSLGYRVKRETTNTVTDLLADTERISRYSDVRAYTSQSPTRLEVISSDDDPKISTALGEKHYRTASELLEHYYNLVLMDTGTGILDSSTRGIVELADQIVLVMAPSLDGSRAASLTLDWLNEHGYGDLASNAVTVINQVRKGGLVEIERIEEHFDRRTRQVVTIPWDPHLEAGAETQPEDLKNVTRAAYLQLAAAVASGFNQQPSHKEGE